MRKRTFCLCIMPLVCFIAFGSGTFVFSDGTDLVSTLVKALGVTSKQAEGGAGSIFSFAKENMTEDDFNKVTTALPEVSSLLSAAPKSGSKSSIGALSSMLGDSAGSAGGLASLTESFSKLGLNSDMVGKFIPVVLDYAKSQGGEVVFNLLKSVLP